MPDPMFHAFLNSKIQLKILMGFLFHEMQLFSMTNLRFLGVFEGFNKK